MIPRVEFPLPYPLKIALIFICVRLAIVFTLIRVGVELSGCTSVCIRLAVMEGRQLVDMLVDPDERSPCCVSNSFFALGLVDEPQPPPNYMFLLEEYLKKANYIKLVKEINIINFTPYNSLNKTIKV